MLADMELVLPVPAPVRVWCTFTFRFFLITSVIYEKMPYYAFQLLHYSREDEKDQLFHYREKTDRLLFRLVNYLQPASMLEIGTGCGLDTRYMAEAKHVPLFTIDEERQDKARIKHVLSAYPLVDYRTGNVLRLLDEALTGRPFADLIHIGHTPYYKEAFERLLPMVTDRTCIIVGAPYATREKNDGGSRRLQIPVRESHSICMTSVWFSLIRNG